MMTKLEIKAPYMEPAIYEFHVQDIDLGDDILYNDYHRHIYNAFHAYLDEAMGMIDLMGLEYLASEVLKAVDEIAYRGYFNDWFSSEVEYAYDAIDTYGYAVIGDIEINLIVDSEEEEEEEEEE